MQNPLYFLCPDNQRCHDLAAKLRAHGIPAEHLAPVRAVEDHEHSLLEELTPGPRTRRGIFQGVLLGAAAGFAGGILALRHTPAGVRLDAAVVVMTTLLGGVLAAIITGLLSRDLPHPELAPLGPEDTAGAAVLMVGGSERNRQKALRYVRRNHPDVRIALPRADRHPDVS